MKDNESLLDLAQVIEDELLRNGIILHRYDARSTDSIYIKLDYGLANSIRISDHKGKGHIHYKYNIGPNISKLKVDRSGKYPIHYYPTKFIDKMIKDILEERDLKIKKYGINRYRDWMNEKIVKFHPVSGKALN